MNKTPNTNDLSTVKVTWHPSARHVLAAIHDIAIEDLDGAQMECLTTTGTTAQIDISTLDEQPMWAVALTEERVIHAYADQSAATVDVARMLAHEVGHLVGTPASDDIEEEHRADLFGDITAFAIRETIGMNEQMSKNLRHCMIAVRDWMQEGCDADDIPRPHIATLVNLADYVITSGVVL